MSTARQDAIRASYKEMVAGNKTEAEHVATVKSTPATQGAQTTTSPTTTTPAPATATTQTGVQQGGNGIAGGFTGTRQATTPDGKQITVNYNNGQLDTTGLQSGTVVHTNGGDFRWDAPAATPAATPGSPSYVANIDPNANKYIFGTKAGHDALESVLKGGQTDVRLTDGSYIRRDANGQVYVQDKNGSVLGYQDTYQPSPVEGDKVNPSPVTDNLRNYLNQWLTNAQKQIGGQIDYATNKGINDLTRAEQDAQAQFQTQRNQVDRDEALSKDNQALYAEARGDRGGIGAAQYDSIQNTAAQNRLSVNQAQTKLSTDTARQIADLRAQGEFEKADKLLDITQNYLSQLMSLEQWAANYNLSVAEFNAGLDQWQASFELEAANVTGYYKGNKTMQVQQYEDNKRGQVALESMRNGIWSDDWKAAGFSSVDSARAYTDYHAREQEKADSRSLIQTAIQYGYNVSDDIIKASGYDPVSVRYIIDGRVGDKASEKAGEIFRSAMELGFSGLADSVITDAGYDLATGRGMLETAAANIKKTDAQTQVEGLINAGLYGTLQNNPELVKAAGFELGPMVDLAKAQAEAKKASGSGGGGPRDPADEDEDEDEDGGDVPSLKLGDDATPEQAKGLGLGKAYNAILDYARQYLRSGKDIKYVDNYLLSNIGENLTEDGYVAIISSLQAGLNGEKKKQK